jgi:hypothetical protein
MPLANRRYVREAVWNRKARWVIVQFCKFKRICLGPKGSYSNFVLVAKVIQGTGGWKVARGGGDLNVAGTINEESSSMSERLLTLDGLYVKRHLTKECRY